MSGGLAAEQQPQKLDLCPHQVGGDPGGPLLRVGVEVLDLGGPERVNQGREIGIHAGGPQVGVAAITLPMPPKSVDADSTRLAHGPRPGFDARVAG